MHTIGHTNRRPDAPSGSHDAAVADPAGGRPTPGQWLDQAIGLARDNGGGDFARNLGRQVRNNPLPVALVGAGLAWLMLSSGKWRRASHDGGGAAHDGSRAVPRHDSGVGLPGAPLGHYADRRESTGPSVISRAGSAISDAGSRVGSTIGNAASSVGDLAASAYDRATDIAGHGYSAAADGLSAASERVGDTASHLRRHGPDWDAMNDISNVFRRQPLLLGAVGVAIGAAMGAAVPVSEAENRLLGPTSDEFKDRARQLTREHVDKAQQIATEQYSKLKDAASQAVGEVKGELQGLRADNAAERVRHIGEAVGAVADAAAKGLDEAASSTDLLRSGSKEPERTEAAGAGNDNPAPVGRPM